jgi:hypothetical protein
MTTDFRDGTGDVPTLRPKNGRSMGHPVQRFGVEERGFEAQGFYLGNGGLISPPQTTNH